MKRAILAMLGGMIAGVIALALASAIGLTPHREAPRHRLVAEDASAPLARIAIHYAPAADDVAVPVYRQLFAVLPARIDVEVAVAAAPDFDRFLDRVAPPSPERFHPVVVGRTITTWSRDRFAAMTGAILAPPRVETAFGARAGDMESPHAISRALYRTDAETSRVVFEGGDLAASAHTLFVGSEILARSRGRGDVTRDDVQRELARHFDEPIVWLDGAPHHHVMMYMVPLDDHTALVGDPREGARLAPQLDLDPEQDELAARFDQVAAELAARGMQVIRVPVAVLRGAGAYVTYTNALFDREGVRKVVYLPTYRVPALDLAAERLYEQLGYTVRPIDVSGIYQLNGSLGCLVNVLGRGGSDG